MQVAMCELYSVAYIIMFSGGELWATDGSDRDLSDLRAKLRHRQR